VAGRTADDAGDVGDPERQPYPPQLGRVLELFPRLRERRAQLGKTLSGGEQQMLAIGRALVGSPKLLLVDEQSEGLAPMVLTEIFESLLRVCGTPGLRS
jgi:branched-chain amino acid transport system ATP-binding protein